MAKLGEGDPRWRVEERADGANVNAWHWSEKNCTEWSKARIIEILAGVEIGSCKVASVESVKGDVTYCNRKRKNMFFYDLELKVKWTGELEGKTVKGEAIIRNFDQDADDLSIDVTSKSTADGVIGLRRQLRKDINQVFAKKAHDFKKDLSDEYSEEFGEVIQMKVLAPVRLEQVADPGVKDVPTASAKANAAAAKASSEKAASAATGKPVETKVSTRTINKKLVYEAPAKELFECFVDSRRISAFTQSEATLKAEEGSSFTLFSGQVSGTVKKVVPGEKLVLSWRSKDWRENHFSTVNLSFKTVDGGTELVLKQTGVPSDDVDRSRAGWNNYFWPRIRATFGWQFREL